MAKEVNKNDNKKEEKVAKKSTNTMRSELKKVTWPTRKELVNSTIAVIFIVVLTAIIVFFFDVVFESLNTYGINKLRTTISEKVNKQDNTTIQDAQEEVVTDEVSPVEAESETTAEANSNVDATTETPTTEE